MPGSSHGLWLTRRKDGQVRQHSLSPAPCPQALWGWPPWWIGLDHLCTWGFLGTQTKGQACSSASSQVRRGGSRLLLQHQPLGRQVSGGRRNLEVENEDTAFKLLLLLPKMSFPDSVCPALSLVSIWVPINLDLSRVLLTKACIGLTQRLPDLSPNGPLFID